VCGYGLLAAAWLIMKTEDVTQEWARKCAGYLFGFVAVFMGLVSLRDAADERVTSGRCGGACPISTVLQHPCRSLSVVMSSSCSGADLQTRA
jgi:cytochrome bd-type quinol oxidase subunit 2